jgi:hypothetical protein
LLPALIVSVAQRSALEKLRNAERLLCVRRAGGEQGRVGKIRGPVAISEMRPLLLVKGVGRW